MLDAAELTRPWFGLLYPRRAQKANEKHRNQPTFELVLPHPVSLGIFTNYFF
jgi:hypothetical protein